MRAILVDDHTMFREGLVSILSSRGGGIEVVGHSSMGEEALALIREHRPDVVITQKKVDLNKAKEVLRSFVRPAPGVAALRLVAAKVAIADHVAGECLRVRVSSRKASTILSFARSIVANRNVQYRVY